MADNNSKKIKSSDLLPRFYRSDANKKFLQATVDQLTQPGTVTKVNGYIGRKNAKASTGADIFVNAVSADRQNYQLEPSLVIKDTLDNVSFFKDYQDYINQLGVFGANTKNHARLNKQEMYSWDPHIDWDKFVNFQNYYWLPFGPDLIKIAGQQQKIESEFTVAVESELDSYTYVITPNGLIRNPTIKLYKGQTYKFIIDAVGNPFSIKTRRTGGTLDRYSEASAFAVESGTITITIPYDAPSVLYYVSENNIDVGGVFQILSIDENTAIDVTTEIIGKRNYKLANGTALSNGMKVSFIGKVTPIEYATGEYYVEGVGSAITLVKESNLELISGYTDSEAVLFDTTPFDNLPFSDATSLANAKDYITINRSSLDRNPWSRYNRWVHKDVAGSSAEFNNKIPSLDQSARAIRPIIEFEPGLKLFNFGLRAVPDVDLIDTFTTDVFSNIEGQLGYNVDGIPLATGQRILFTADTDKFVKNKVYKVEFRNLQRSNNTGPQIHLVLDSEPVLNDVVIVKQGKLNQGISYWFNGITWIIGQGKTSTNQPPLFDIVDDNGTSYSNTTVYDGSTFAGTPIFSYKIGSSTADATLGFPLAYKNISNVGDILFNFNILSDTFYYKELIDIITKTTSVGYLVKFNNVTETIEYTNGWKTTKAQHIQAAIRIYKNSNKTNNFELDIFDNIANLEDLVVRVYVNGFRLDKSLWTIIDTPVYKKVVLNTNVTVADVITLRAFAQQPINANGYYEIPVSLQNNPLNAALSEFTLGEVIDHVNSIVDNLETFEGAFPGASNLRDLGDITSYGTKFLQHSGPGSLSLYHITSTENNVIKAIEESKDDYGKFKRNFISIIDTIGNHPTDPVAHVNLILQEIFKDKPKTSPYYFSDMVGYGASIRNAYPVIDYRIKTYPLTNVFNLDALSNSAVYVYLNGDQLLYTRDYTFNSQGFIVITNSVIMNNDDEIVIYEYENTDACYIPQTPTKLGIWPAYEPKKYLDTSLITPREMIQGHDGSQVLAYGDYRDNLILELEKRIFNNIKIKYDSTIFDITELVPSYIRSTDYSLEEFNEVLAPQFYKWTTLIDRDFTKPLSFDRTNPVTFNYRGHTAPDGRETPGYWRGIYRWMLDTDRPNLCPWEMLGFTIEPSWWQEVYGPAPYTSDNRVLWEDLSQGLVKEPNKPVVTLKNYTRPFLSTCIPVDESGNIQSPMLANLSTGTVTTSTTGDYVFGDVSPVEAAWRRSSYYPFAILITSMLVAPAKTFGTLLDRSRIVRNLTGQLVYKETGLRVQPAAVVLPSIYSSTTRVQTAGIINYIIDYVLSDNLKSYSAYKYNLQNINCNLSYRIGAFTSKEKFNLLLDSKTPTSSGSVFVPQEDYDIILNTSSPIKKITYSGVVITKLADGYEVKGYSKTAPYFKYYPWLQSGPTINVGGISESYAVWTVGMQYAAGKILKYNNRYYKSLALHTTTSTFDPSKYASLGTQVPVIGGRDATLRTLWDRESVITAPYGTKFKSPQAVVDFLIGYGEYLKDQGFIFDNFNNNLNVVTNWTSSAKEFLFWTTQNWSSGQDKWEDWLPNVDTEYQAIVKYNGDYYQALRKSFASDIFKETDFTKLDGLNTVGSSVISLSPSANSISFSVSYSVVDDIKNPFNSYEIFKVDGSPVAPNFLNSYREDNAVTYAPAGADGLFGASFYLIQKEQVVILKNTTMFNDTIYNPESGYRQERIKVNGYTSTNWQGSFDAPGFIFDQAKISDWTAWTDYALGDIVKYKEFYYSASTSIVGTSEFVQASWTKLDKRPTTRLIPNWTYKAQQFTDFYDLDSDNFDTGQQKVAQHLVGYQKRQYLENIIKDDVSEYKFFQGMIIEKGTQNVLNKLFDVLSADGTESLKFYEEWAVRVGQYGASAAFENIEFTLPHSLFKNNPQGFELVNATDPTTVDFVIRQTPTDIYLKPLGYNSNPWPTVPEYISYLRTPGYVRTDEVTAVIQTIDEITKFSPSNFKNGDYVWCGFEGHEWNVYRYTPSDINVTNVTHNQSVKELTIETTSLITLSVGSFIGIETVAYQGFYKIKSVKLNSIVCTADIPGGVEYAGEYVPILIFKSHRASSIDVVDTVVQGDLIPGELVWTDDGGDGKWTTWKYTPVFKSNDLLNLNPSAGLSFGRTVNLNKNGNIATVSTSLGTVAVYNKASPVVSWIQRQTISRPFMSIPDVSLGDYNAVSTYNETSAMSSDGRWLALGSPAISKVATTYRGAYSLSSTYSTGQIVKDGALFYKALVAVPLNRQPAQNPIYWRVTYSITADTAGTNSSYISQGAVSIYERDPNGIYNLINTFISPALSSGEQFGSTLAFADDTLFVSAIGNNSYAGKVYQLDYLARPFVRTTFIPTGSTHNTIQVASTAGIEAGMSVSGLGITLGQVVTSVVNSTTLLLDSPPDGDPFGQLTFSNTVWGYTSTAGITESVLANVKFGENLQVSTDNSTLLISLTGRAEVKSTIDDTILQTFVPGAVYVYQKTVNGYTKIQTINGVGTANDVNFGKGITVSNTGAYIAISSIFADDKQLDQGSVSVYKKGISTYTLYQTLTNTKPEVAGFFGSKLAFMNDYNTLVIYSEAADTRNQVIFDSNTTTFDDKLTSISSLHLNSGRVDVYDRYNTNVNGKWIFSESLPTSNVDGDGYGNSVAIGANHIFVSAPSAIDKTVRSGKVYEYSKTVDSYSWTVLHKEINKPDLTKIKSAFLYNKLTHELVSYIDIVDPVQGKIPGIADQEIKYKTFYDPAVYSVGDNLVTVDDGMAWTSTQSGMLWWDLRTAKFIDSYDNNLIYRNSTWNHLFPGASIDIYEWVETSLLPADWDLQSDTDAGIALGISGKSLYGNTAYSIKRRYDNVAKVFKNTYYYWVKNKKTVPVSADRHLSAQDVSDVISNPRGQGYKYLALTSDNSFSLVNIANLLDANNIVLSVQYWTADHRNQNIHSQWKMINSDPDTSLPATIEQKWVDSLCGKDLQGRLVPDTSLPVKIRYGVENRPRQGMFVNRFEALKQFIEKINTILLASQIVGQRNLTLLQSYETEPSLLTGLYDTVFDTDAELRFANVGSFKQPSLSPIIVDGKIVDVIVNVRGSGYVVAPYIEVVGSGINAKIKAKINTKGQITGATIISSGEGYSDSTVLIVRNYSVLIHSDSQALGNWSIYSYAPATLTWSRERSQAYDTRKYWSYTDWYATGYSQFSAADFSVDTLVGLTSLAIEIGQLVKVRADSNGQWMLLAKYANSQSVDWTQSYHVVGRQQGTIQFASTLYQFANTSNGYDGTLYDGNTFDNSAVTELRNILLSLKTHILIDDLKQSYLDVFFACVRYAFSEQNYLDWIFKTSFVKAQHNVGELKQPVTYKNDNLEDFESYIAEVKPYRTKIREYVSAYTRVDTSELSVTDFDIPPIYSNNKLSIIDTQVIDGQIVADDNIITEYPWKHWLDNNSFTITEIKLVDGGQNYHQEPVVRFKSTSGSGATARAFITNGKVTRIVLLTPGSGYLTAPTIILDGGLKVDGVAGRAVAIIGNSVVRSNLIKMKFDRITQTYFITKLEDTATFIGTGSRLQFSLTWAPNVRIGKSSVTINGVDVLRDDYKLTIVKSVARGYTSYSGLITFTTAVAKGASIVVNYIKDWSLLNAADRIQYYYNPTSGELGKDLSQLMSGVDYGGVIIDGLGFDVSQGWGSVPYYTDRWDSFDGTFDDYIVTVAANTHSFTLPYTPESGTQINVYHVKQSVQTYTSDGTATDYPFSSKTDTPTVTITRIVNTSGANLAGTDVLQVTSTQGLISGDVVTTSTNGVFGYNTIVKQVIDSTHVRLDQILFADVTVSTPITFVRTLIKNIGYFIDVVGILVLAEPAALSSVVTISAPLLPVRLDDLHYDTPQQTNTDAIISTFIGDGSVSTIVIPSGYDVNAGDEFILRKSTSDGSIKPQESDYDTALIGGNLTYSSATGVAAEDIIVDGDGFVTPTSSPATEELVPGQLFDSLAIKVFDRPSSGSANIHVDNFKGDSANRVFKLTQQPNTSQSIIVKVGNSIKTVTDDYTVDYKDNLITLTVAPTTGTVVSVFNFGFNGSNILDIDYFIGNGSTTEFITKAPWLENITGLVYLDGVPATSELFETDLSYESNKRVGIRFSTPPHTGSIINFVIVSGTEQTFSVTKTEHIQSTGAYVYPLQNIVGDTLPIESNMIVRVGQQILKAPVSNYFTIKNNKLTYTLDQGKYLPYSLDITDINVYANGILLKLGTDYTADLSVINIKLDKPVYEKYKNKILTISTRQAIGYSYIPPTSTQPAKIQMATAYNGPIIEVISSYKHDILDIQRTGVNISSNVTFTPDSTQYYNYTGITGGNLILERAVLSDSYVWVIKNGSLLVPSVDYKLNQDHASITLASNVTSNDDITLMTFSGNVLTAGISYMQFKDMLNRTHFKRLSLNKRTVLVRDLHQTSTEIEVEDASNFDVPNILQNKPGIIEIRGERIEYFKIAGNVLSQLRRGTLGTGTPLMHRVGAYVQEIGPTETIPYADVTETYNIVSNGTNLVNLKFTPTLTSISTTWFSNFGYTLTGEFKNTTQYFPNDVVIYNGYYYANISRYTSNVLAPSSITPIDTTYWKQYMSIPATYGQTDEIEVFVGGYNSTSEWGVGVSYNVGDIITVASYTYRCTVAHTSSAVFDNDSANWAFFVGNIRLKKTPYVMYNVHLAPESPEGDIQLDPDFAVDGESNQIRLTTPLPVGTKITIVRKTGADWDGKITESSMYNTEKIGNFIKATPGVWYTSLAKYESVGSNGTYDSIDTTLDNSQITFDKEN